MTTTDRLIQVLSSVNSEAIDADGGKPGEYLARHCREAADQLRSFTNIDSIPLDGPGADQAFACLEMLVLCDDVIGGIRDGETLSQFLGRIIDTVRQRS